MFDFETLIEVWEAEIDDPLPSHFDIQRFNGGIYAKRWDRTAEDWRCPACKRLKRETIRKIKKHDGWHLTWSVHKHHDHGSDHGLPRRFWPTYVCQLCNSADATAKIKLDLPSVFSFAPWEIYRFIVSNPHQKHKIRINVAEQIFKKEIYPRGWANNFKLWESGARYCNREKEWSH